MKEERNMGALTLVNDGKSTFIIAHREDMEAESAKQQHAAGELMKVLSERPPLAKELAAYRKYVPLLINGWLQCTEMNKLLCENEDRIADGFTKNKNKRWTDTEDDYLVQMCADGTSIVDICCQLGRSPGAVKTRLSNLVGIGRISSEIAGRFIGEIDGEAIEGKISGTLFKTA